MIDFSEVLKPGLEHGVGQYYPVLAHGFVEVVDIMGSDADICKAARVSYNNDDGGLWLMGDVQVQKDQKLIRYLMRNNHCYDSDTEVLTRRGFVLWPQVRDDDELGIWDPELQSLCYEVPKEVVHFEYEGQMYEVDHGGVSLVVTPDHKMWVSVKNGTNNTWPSWSLIPASELGHRSMVRYTKIAPYRIGEDLRKLPLGLTSDRWEAFGKLLGFFIGDGFAGGTAVNSVSFHLKKERKLEFLREVSAQLGWELREGDTLRVRQSDIGPWFQEHCYSGKHKCLPSFVLEQSLGFQQAVLEGLRQSDGSEKRGAWVFSTSSPVLREQFYRLVVHCGEVANEAAVHPVSGVSTTTVMSRSRQPVINQSRRNTRMVDYRGDVHCATTRTGILVVRRRGKVVLSGNTSPFEMAEIKFHLKLPIFVMRQLVRHRTANLNEVSARYTEMEDEFYVPDLEQVRGQHATNKQAGGDTLPEEGADKARHIMAWANASAYKDYETLLKLGVARELARIVLPVSLYTRCYWKMDLHNLLHFLKLRLDWHAQWEIRQYALAMAHVVSLKFPQTWQAFCDYRLKEAGE